MRAMLSKILVANRGEIAIRGFRAAYELGIDSVAIYPYEDRNSTHRQKAGEAYQIGEVGHPVRAYLDVAEVIAAARKAGADAIYPGYGFLSENPELAHACEEAGITFIGPPATVLELAGNKTRAINAAREAGLPVLESTAPTQKVDELLAAAPGVGFPLFVKAVAGGGGRGMRRVDNAADLAEAIEMAMREAESAFGDPTVFLERAVIDPRHIEVQILADSTGAAVHLFERDCSVQRRHQKVIEVAPAINLDPDIRRAMCEHAVAFARHIGYVNAGTVEFLLGKDGHFAFIEMNPRIQVEHTITEEITDVDLVQSQIRIAAGETLADLGLTQDTIMTHGAAIQARVTSEDPANGFRPDTGTIITYRSPGGAGVRIDGGTVHAGAEVSAHFDSLLVKLSCRGADWAQALRRTKRALAEFRVRGIATNISFLQAVLDEPDFAAGGVTTSFIANHPYLLTARHSADRGTRLLTYLADVTVNQPHGPRPALLIDPVAKLPQLSASVPASGSRQQLAALGPEKFAAALRAQTAVGVTDTSFRDAHQSLLATRVRTRDLAAVAPAVAQLTPQLFSIEAWGGATFDVALRFLSEDPWERLDALSSALPNINLQMLLRGRNMVGYTPYPPQVTTSFVNTAAEAGVQIFRIFDALNDVSQMRAAIDAVQETGSAVAEVALCYTADLADPQEKLYTLDYYLRVAEEIVATGAHILCVKDMAGLLRAPAARQLISALRERFDLPVHLHTHDTAGGQLATYLAAMEAGVDVVDVASAPMAGTTSQPPMSALVAATDHTERATGLSLAAVQDLEPYWEAVRALYSPFETGLRSPTGRVYRHEIPGGQLSNLRQQADALGLADRFEDIERIYAAADAMLGRLIKVTPSSKVVGDLALHLVGAGVDPAAFEADPGRFDIPDSVVGFLSGELGVPVGGWPQPFRDKAIAGRSHTPTRGELTDDDQANLEAHPRETLNRLLFPAPAGKFYSAREEFADVSVLPTSDYLYGLNSGTEHVIDLATGVQLIAGVEAVGEPDERGMRSVITTLNGQLRPLQVRDRAISVDVPVAERADSNNPNHIAAPFAGVVTLRVEVGDSVAAGDVIGVIEAMKMEASITTHQAGVVGRAAIGPVQQVEGGDLIVVLGAPEAD